MVPETTTVVVVDIVAGVSSVIMVEFVWMCLNSELFFICVDVKIKKIKGDKGERRGFLQS